MTGKFSDERPEHHMTGSSELRNDHEKTTFLNYVDGDISRTEAKHVKDATVTAKDQTRVIQRIRRDTMYSSKFWLYVWICISLIVLRLFAGHTGPVFPDLGFIVNKDLATSSWLLTAGTMRYLAGSPIFGVLYDKFNRLLLLFLVIMDMSLASGIAPWCSFFPLRVTMRAIAGAGVGGLDTSIILSLSIESLLYHIRPY